jgi:hypothetical protein
MSPASSGSKNKTRKLCLPPALTLISCFYHEDGDDMFFRNIDWLSTYCTALWPRRQYSSFTIGRHMTRACDFVLIVSVPLQSLNTSQQLRLLRGAVNPAPNLQPGGPGYRLLPGSSPLTCPAWQTLPVATLPPA